MYVYFEHQRDAEGKVVLTELCLSSLGTGALKITWRDKTEAMLFELCRPILKYPPVAMRSYDERSNVWMYLESWGEQVLQRLTAVTALVGGITKIQVEDLAAQAMNHRVSFKKQTHVRPEDFFYNNTAPATAAESKETVAAKLAPLLEIKAQELAAAEPAALKKLYRRAALRLHPDRNNGNGALMSELNMLWSVYNA
jgi:hypothetical protein